MSLYNNMAHAYGWTQRDIDDTEFDFFLELLVVNSLDNDETENTVPIDEVL